MRRTSPSPISPSRVRREATYRRFEADEPTFAFITEDDGPASTDHLVRPWSVRPPTPRCDDRPAGRMTLFA